MSIVCISLFSAAARRSEELRDDPQRQNLNKSTVSYVLYVTFTFPTSAVHTSSAALGRENSTVQFLFNVCQKNVLLSVKFTSNISNRIHVSNAVGRVSDSSIRNGDEIKLGKNS